MTLLRIAGGTVYDPAHDINGEVRDLWISDGRIVEPPPGPDVKPDRTLDAAGLVVMPGGIDMHCHIAGPKVNTARKMMPDDHRVAPPVRRTLHTRSGVTGAVPSTFATGYLYAGLGYTTAFDAAIPPLAARHAHEELQDTPILDKGFYVLLGNNHYVMKQLQAGEPERLKAYVAWILNAAKGYAAKLVNPGGVEVWKSTGGNTSGIDDVVEHFNVTPRQIIQGVARVADELRLPHPVHIHCNNLGLPGNWSATLDTMQALEGHRGHLTHVQFHSYGGDPDRQSTFRSEVPKLVEYVNAHPNLTVDVGQVMFAETTSMTGDGPLGYFLHKVTGRKWFSADTEMETGCGIVPITYKEKSLVHALQWAIGLEWYLLMDDPWRVAMSTDHPNGASFLAYPEIIALLMSRARRQEALDRLPPRVKERCVLAELDREYSLDEIAIITRAAPARMLGLKTKGHLGPGADADVALYQPDNDIQRMFELPRYVLRGGEVVVDGGEVRASPDGRTLHVAPAFDEAALPDIQAWFEQYYTIQWRNYPVDDHYMGKHEVVACTT
ncbi:MAG TPA: formylmethanofuran dehydrogenase subunit A [Planctomycetaceae bacterium]|nr:formylmethanofuran dehydrogenase subunit A [Planctomycetaceae bacterium]